MDTKDSIVVLLLLQSLGLFGSVTYCVWNKQSQLASELDDIQNKLQVQSEVQNELKKNVSSCTKQPSPVSSK